MSQTEKTSDVYLSYEDIAKLIEVKTRSVHTYQRRARRNRAAGNVQPGDMPEPDLKTPRSPMWKESTIRDWLKHRRPYTRAE